MTANYGVQRTATLMPCVINDSDPRGMENKQGTAKGEEQKERERKGSVLEKRSQRHWIKG